MTGWMDGRKNGQKNPSSVPCSFIALGVGGVVTQRPHLGPLLSSLVVFRRTTQLAGTQFPTATDWHPSGRERVNECWKSAERVMMGGGVFLFFLCWGT